MQLEERYEKLAAEQAQRERRSLLMQAARRRLEAAAGTAATGPAPLPAALGDEAEVAVAELVAGVLDAAPAAPKPSPTDSMSSDEIDALMTGAFSYQSRVLGRRRHALSSVRLYGLARGLVRAWLPGAARGKSPLCSACPLLARIARLPAPYQGPSFPSFFPPQASLPTPRARPRN